MWPIIQALFDLICVKRFSPIYFLVMVIVITAEAQVAAQTQLESGALILLRSKNIEDMHQSIKELEGLGVHVLHVFPPRALICVLPTNLEPLVATQRIVYACQRNSMAVPDESGALGDARMGILAWNRLVTPAPPPESRLSLPIEPLAGDAFPHPAGGSATIRKADGTTSLAAAPSFDQTSEFMIGNVAVGIILPESNGAIDPSTENWSSSRQDQVIQEITAGCNWWITQGGANAHLTFYYDVHRSVPTRFEPIGHPYNDEALWIPDTLGYLGYSGSGRFDVTRRYISALRSQYHSDWGFAIFVVDSLNDPDGKFSDGYFAYSYINGPFMVMTYDNDGYGISNMDVVTSHEMGHIFGALDEYSGASGCYAYSGYLNVMNGNHADCPAPVDSTCIMRGGIRSGLCTFSRGQIGWRDSDGDGIIDPADTSVSATLLLDPSALKHTLTGVATDVAYPPPSPNRQPCTINTITGVVYRVDGGAWLAATPSDGTFNSGEESYTIFVPCASSGYHTTEVQARNSVGNVGSDSFTWSAVADLIYVNRSFNGNNPNGTICAPFPTVTQGYQAAQSGNTVRIFSGNYNETLLNMNKALRLEATNGVVNIGTP